MTTKFAQVKSGLDANVAWRADVVKEERARWQSVLAQVPKSREKMAVILLGDPRVHMTDAEIIETCNVGHASPDNSDTSSTTGRQALYAAGLTETARLLGKPAPVTIPEAYPARSREFHIDRALYAAGEAMAQTLKPFMANAR